jgi:hypothetical protein
MLDKKTDTGYLTAIQHLVSSIQYPSMGQTSPSSPINQMEKYTFQNSLVILIVLHLPDQELAGPYQPLGQ